MLEHGVAVRFLMATNVNTPFLKYPRQLNSGTVPVPEYKVLTLQLYSGTDISGTQCLNAAGAQALMLGHQVDEKTFGRRDFWTKRIRVNAALNSLGRHWQP